MVGRRLAPDGELADFKEVAIESAEDEDWNEYHLEDGSVLKTKTILSRVAKAVNQEGEELLDDEGEPQYKVQFDSVIELEENGSDE